MSSLVSVIVVTFNSSKFVEETLNSINAQTWTEIELIITDDCSKDDTVSLCKEWLKKSNRRFVSAEIIESERNTGVPANVNRGLREAKGDWICFPAGDDTLMPNCIKDNMDWIDLNPSAKVLFSVVEIYRDKFHKDNHIKKTPVNPYNPGSIMADGRTAESQYKMLLTSDRIHYTPSLFIDRKTLMYVGGFDERFRLLEDYPLWLNLTRKGFRLHFMNKVTVNYRKHSAAINNTGQDFLVNPNYYKQEDLRRICTYPNLPADIRLCQRFSWYASQIFRINWLNKNKQPNRFLHAILTNYLNPFKYLILLRKRINKSLKDNVFYCNENKSF